LICRMFPVRKCVVERVRCANVIVVVFILSVCFGFARITSAGELSTTSADGETRLMTVPDGKTEDTGLYLFVDKKEQTSAGHPGADSDLPEQQESRDRSIDERATEGAAPGFEEKRKTTRKARENEIRYNGLLARGSTVLGVWINGQRVIQQNGSNTIVTDAGDGTVRLNGDMLMTRQEKTLVIKPGQSVFIAPDGISFSQRDTKQKGGVK